MTWFQYFGKKYKDFYLDVRLKIQKISNHYYHFRETIYDIIKRYREINFEHINFLLKIFVFSTYDNNKLISFCTYAELDEIQPTDLTPWIGFAYTFPEYRGNRYLWR